MNRSDSKTRATGYCPNAFLVQVLCDAAISRSLKGFMSTTRLLITGMLLPVTHLPVTQLLVTHLPVAQLRQPFKMLPFLPIRWKKKPCRMALPNARAIAARGGCGAGERPTLPTIGDADATTERLP